MPEGCRKDDMNSVKVQFYIDVEADLLARAGSAAATAATTKSSSMPPPQQHQQGHQEQDIRNGVELQECAGPEANRLTLFIV